MLTLSGVSKTYGRTTALHAIDLQVTAGSVCVLLVQCLFELIERRALPRGIRVAIDTID